MLTANLKTNIKNILLSFQISTNVLVFNLALVIPMPCVLMEAIQPEVSRARAIPDIGEMEHLETAWVSNP